MEALIRFMYHGEVHIGQDQLPDFLRTAQTLQVRGLAEVSSKDQHKLSVSYFIYYIICTYTCILVNSWTNVLVMLRK